jgi:hypothetical protein
MLHIAIVSKNDFYNLDQYCIGFFIYDK